MATHKFRVGQMVELVPGLPMRYAPADDYKIVRQLPNDHGEVCYRVKSADKPCERVVKESPLRRIESA